MGEERNVLVYAPTKSGNPVRGGREKASCAETIVKKGKLVSAEQGEVKEKPN